jgi:hypothetical protein
LRSDKILVFISHFIPVNSFIVPSAIHLRCHVFVTLFVDFLTLVVGFFSSDLECSMLNEIRACNLMVNGYCNGLSLVKCCLLWCVSTLH